MPTIRFEDHAYALEAGESVLACLERHEHEIPNACRSGVCHSCILQRLDGDLPPASQKGMGASQQARGFFLSCQCYPESDLAIARGADGLGRVGATLVGREVLNHRVLQVSLKVSDELSYFPGQFVNFVRPDGLVRSFSLASVPAIDEHLHFHVALVEGGQMSGWLHQEAEVGATLELLGPLGNCFYVPGDPDQPLFLLGTGTGLAPLYGIVRDALHQGHRGPIHLFHGSLVARDLYLTESLRGLAASYENFSYHACVRDEGGGSWLQTGAVDEIALNTIPDLKGWKVFLCGNPVLVKQMQRKTFLAGASMRDIYADAFLPAGGGAA